MGFSNLFRTKDVAQIKRDAELGYGDHGELTVEDRHLRKTLGVVDLTAFGIAAIIGAGIFSTIGTAAFNGGPAVAFLFVFTAIACAFSALCYAEFASQIPGRGLGLHLRLRLLRRADRVDHRLGLAHRVRHRQHRRRHLVERLLHGAARRLQHQHPRLPDDGLPLGLARLRGAEHAHRRGQARRHHRRHEARPTTAWTTAPRVAGIPIVCDLPALFIVLVITVLVYIGIRESKRASNIMVAVKIAVVLMVIVVGASYINTENWSPFAPNGLGGVLKGVSAVFFAYIGFDAITTTAEECKNPQRDLPLGMIFSLIICTVLYIAIALVLTGIVELQELEGVGDPLALRLRR